MICASEPTEKTRTPKSYRTIGPRIDIDAKGEVRIAPAWCWNINAKATRSEAAELLRECRSRGMKIITVKRK